MAASWDAEDFAGTVASQVDPIQIAFKYLVFGESFLDSHSQKRFSNLSQNSLLSSEIDISRELLRNCARALECPVLYVPEKGTHNSPRVNSPMIVEPFILNGEERLQEHVRHLQQRNKFSRLIIFPVAFAD